MATAAPTDKNEALFRELNQWILGFEENLGRENDKQIEFICESSAASCIERVPMGLDEFEQVRTQASV